MADIRLAKPAAGTTQTVPSAPDGRFIFDFPADAATLTRNGDDLVLTFEDGAAIQLQGFYTTYSKEEMPSFQVDGVEISGQDFFAALDEDLMPAAGPASGSSAARGGRYNEYGGSDLLDGLDHLGRLDIGFDGGTQLATDTVEPSPYSEVDHGVTVTPSTPGTDPDDPSIPVQGEDFPPTMPHDVLQVDESALDGGSGGGSATAAGSMRVSAPDDVAIITIGGVVVWQNGALTGNPVLTDEGHLDVTGFDGTNLTYTYTLTGSTQEHTKLNAGGENDAIAHEMAVVVTDTDGDSGSAVIRVEITDDVPTIESFEKTVTEGDADPIVGNALEGAVAGADGANFAWTNPDQQGRYGKLTLNEDGTYSYELNNDDPEVKALTDGDTRTEEISYTYTDADGDVATGKVTITINGVNNGVEVGSGTLTVYEAGLADGSQAGQAAAPTTAEGSLTVNAPDGVKDIRIDGVTVFENGALTGNTVSTDEGTLTVTGFDEATGELKFTYELTGNTLEHNTDATDKQLSHDLAVTVTDVDGSTDTGVVTVVITDDGPVVTPVETEYKGNKYVNTVSVSFGADNDTGTDSSLAVNAHDVDGTVIEWIKVDDSTSSGTDLSKLSQGESWTNGNIIVSRENGNFVFKIKENGSNAHITVTATDADGDTDTEELNLTAPDAGPNAIIVDEALLSDGNVVNSDNSDHAPSDTGSFTVNLNGEDGTVTLKYGTGEDASTITLSLINGDKFKESWLSINKTLTVNGVKVTVTDATQTEPGGPWKIEYTYELTGQQTHTGQGVGEDDVLSDDIDITVTDATGDMTTGSLMVTVHDDGPVISDVRFENGYEGNESVSSNVDIRGSFELDYGADREAGDKALTVQINNGTAIEIEFAENSNSATVSTVLGELTVTRGEDGTYSYVIESGESQKIETGDYTLTFTGKDSDGDTASTGAIHVRVKETTTVKLSVSPEDVTEGETITYTATLVDENGNPAVNKGGEITVTLQNGETITIASGASSGTSKPVSPREDEAYVQGDESVSNHITNVSQAGGTSNFENLVADDTPVNVVVRDDSDPTTVQITAHNVQEGSESVVFDIRLSNKPDPSYEGNTTVQVQIGERTYDVLVNTDGQGTLTVPNPNGEDVYQDGSSLTATVIGVTGGNYEKVVTGQSATANITDTIDTTTVHLSATAVANGQYTITATLENKDGLPVAPQEDLTLTLSNGQTITIAANQTKGQDTFTYETNQSLNVTVESVSDNKYENLDFSEAQAEISYDNAQVIVTATNGSEEDSSTNQWEYTFELVDGNNQEVVAQSDIVVTYKKPGSEETTTVTIEAGKSSVTVYYESGNTEDVFKDPSSATVTITNVDNQHIAIGEQSSATSMIEDTIDVTTVHLSATEVVNGQYSLTVTVDNAPQSELVLTLSNNQTITIEAGKTSATQSYDYVPGQSMDISVTGVDGQTDANKDGKISYDEAGEGFYETLDFSKASVNLDIKAGGTVTSYDDATKDNMSGQYEVSIQDSSVGTISQFANGADSVAVFQGENEIGELSIVDGKLFFTQTASYSHAEGENSAVISRDVTVINASGAECELSIAITIEDSLPVAHADRLELETDRMAEGNLLSNDEESADGNTVVHSVTFNDTTKTFDSENNSITLDGRFGSLTVSADGQYTYTLNSNMEIPEAGTVSETFSYNIIDGDGDVSTASATLTILIGKGTLHVKEQKTTVNAEGQETVTGDKWSEAKSLNAEITSVEADEDSIQYEYDLPGLTKLTFEDYKAISDKDGYDHVYETNYGNLYVNEGTGDYKFVLNNEVADPLPEGFEISMSFTMTTKDDLGNLGFQNIVVVIEGTNDQGTLTEAGKSGHKSNQMWLDAKAAGTNTVEDPYDAVTDPNLGTTPTNQPGTATENEDLGSDTTSRVITWLPFTLEDVDLNESVSFEAVYNGAYHSVPNKVDMEGERLQKYVDFLSAHPSTEYSVALSVAWHEFTQKFTPEELGNMLFYKTEGGIFVIVNDAVHVDGTGMDTAQNWLVFIADSDSDALRHMSEGSGTGYEHGIIYQFSFQVKDSNGEIVRTTQTNESGHITGYAETNKVLVHLYGSNDTPTIKIDNNGTFVIHDDDVTNYQSSEIEGNGNANADTESHTLKIIYNNKEFTGNLHGGEVSLWYKGEVLRADVSVNTTDGTNYILSNIKDYKNIGLNSNITVIVTDKYGNTAQYEMHVDHKGDVTAVSGPVNMTGTGDSDSLYGGNGSDTLNGGEGNDSLWGFAGDDTLYGDDGNDRLYGGDGNDRLYGGAGTDVLVGGSGDDTLDGGDGNDVLIGDGQGGFQEIIEGTVNAETFQKYLDQQSVADLDGLIKKYDEMDSEGGDDKLFGGAGDDILIGGSGNDYLDGGAGEDAIFGGSGNDIIVYDSNDYLVSGGSGIDFMVSDDKNLTLSSLLDNSVDDKPLVSGIEVLLKGDAALSLTSLDQLASDYGITLDSKDGKEVLQLDGRWTKTADGIYDFHGGAEEGGLTLETNLPHDSDASSDNGEMAQQVFILEHTNS